MKQRIALAVGLNSVDSSAYGGWDGKLNSAVNDASAAAARLAQGGMDVQMLIGSRATADAITGWYFRLRQLESGDEAVFFDAGHASSDENGESLCAFDGLVTDDVMLELLSKCKAGVKVARILDCCRAAGFSFRGRRLAPTPSRSRLMPAGVVAKRVVRGTRGVLAASVVDFVACGTQEEAGEDRDHGFASRSWFLSDTLKEGRTWRQWNDESSSLVTAIDATQHPRANELSADTFLDAPLFLFDTQPTAPADPFPDVPPPS